jgi:hypothetical protein
MELQPDRWTNKLPDGRTVTYTSNIGTGGAGGSITAQAEGNVIAHSGSAGHEMNRQEIEAVFAGVLAR